MRISDWSSDVGSSDLREQRRLRRPAQLPRQRRRRSAVAGAADPAWRRPRVAADAVRRPSRLANPESAMIAGTVRPPPEFPGDRKSVGSGKGVSIRVDFGGRRIHQKKKYIMNKIKTR